MSTNLPIPSLDPTSSPPSSTSISGIITLLWPYSSSTQTCAFLLSDPDFRLRSKRGQVRVRFTGASAKAVAENHVGIGDAVRIRLEGAVWGEDRESARTPGKSVDGELIFRRRVGLRVWREGRVDGEGEGVEVDAGVSPPASEGRVVAEEESGYRGQFTPAPRVERGLLRRSLDGSSVGDGWTYSSPAFAKRLRLSGDDSFTAPAFDPFVDGEKEKEGKRTSFGTGLRWTYLERTPSPVKDRGGDVEDTATATLRMQSPSRAVRGEEKVQEVDAGGIDAITVDEEESEADMMEITASTRPEGSAASSREAPPSSSPAEPELTNTATPPIDAPARAMPPPSIPLPRLRMPSEEDSEGVQQPTHMHSTTKGPSTPKLEPVQSPNLPLPSPFPADAAPSFPAALNAPPRPYAANSLFGALGNAASVIEKRRRSGRGPQSQPQTPKAAALPPARHSTETMPKEKSVVPKAPETEGSPAASQPSTPPPPPAAETIDLTDDDDKEDEEMLDEVVQAPETDINQSFSTTIPDDGMYDEYQRSMMTPAEVAEEMMDEENEVMADQQFSGQVAAPNFQLEDEEKDEDVEIIEPAAPTTRDLSPRKPPPNAFSLDGAAFSAPVPQQPLSPKRPPETAPDALRTEELKSRSQLATPIKQQQSTSATSSVPTTPQAEKERVKKNTYRSLFGLRSPEAEGRPVVPPAKERQEERYIPGWFFEVGHQHPDGGNGASKELSGVTVGKKASDSSKALNDVAMLEQEAPESQRLGSLDTAMSGAASQKSQESESAARSSKPEVIELDVSSDVEETMDKHEETPKVVVPGALRQSEEEHIAPRWSAAAKAAEHAEPSSEPEQFPSSPIARFRQQREGRDEAHSSDQTPGYLTLPLSPSNSQSLQDMQSQPAVGESCRSKLPPTPRLTQQESSIRTQEHASQKTPAPKLLRNESFLRTAIETGESLVTPQTKTPSRRSARLRRSNVPDVLSEWFSPRSSGIAPTTDKVTEQEIEPTSPAGELNGVDAPTTNGHTIPDTTTTTTAPSSGFATAYSYFSALSKLPELLNPSSQGINGTNTIDILAVVTDRPKDPTRAKSGPRDYFTIFSISDTSLSPSDSTRVEVFRPYKNTLPVAEVGDVVLLRAFAVKSKRRTPYLLSTDASAWCVWRFPDEAEERKPVWARKGNAIGGINEEIKGPPVEFGEEEREHARGLREWWVASQQTDGEMNGGATANGQTAKEITAKL